MSNLFKYYRDSPGARKSLYLAIPLLLVWLAGSSAGFRAEWTAIKNFPELAAASYDDKKFSFEGEIYMLSLRALSIVPRSGSIYFYNPESHDKTSFNYLKAKYYLYPRAVVWAEARFDASEILKNDYLMVYAPVFDYSTISPGLMQRIELVYERKIDGESYEAIFRVKRTGA